MPVDFSYKKFLIIDDFSDFRSSLKRMLQSFGATDIDEASNGEAAVNKIFKNVYDIILCDYNLGFDKKDGQQVFEEAKQRGMVRFSTIFMMITAINTSEMIMGAIEYQPDDYLIKPITREVLRNRLEKAIRKKNDFELIERAIKNKEYLHAIQLCDETISNNPKNIFEYFRLKGELCLTIGNYSGAGNVFREVLQTRDILWAKLGLGKTYFLTEEYEQARDVFKSIIQENKMYLEAYDWLAKTHAELKDLDEAQHVLIAAAEISPKSQFRQKSIGEISYKIQDYSTSEKSFRAAISLGKNSYFKSPSNYTGLAKVLVETKSPEKALDVIRDVRAEFKGSHDASMQAAAMESIALKKMNRDEDARKTINEVLRLIEVSSDSIPGDIAIGLAQTCFELGENGKGTKLMQEIVKNHHDDDTVLRKVGEVFSSANLQDEGEKIISSTRKEIVMINNNGVKLVQEGRLTEAIDYFEKAVRALSGNKIINANAAQALLMFMEQNGKDEELLHRSKQYIDRIKKIDPSYRKYQKLLGMYEKITAS